MKRLILAACLAISAFAPAQTLQIPFRSYSGQFVAIDARHWAGVLATPYATAPIQPFKAFGRTWTGFYGEADILGGAIFGPSGQFTAGTSISINYSWHPSDHIGLGVATLIQNTQKPVYRPFFGVGWNF